MNNSNKNAGNRMRSTLDQQLAKAVDEKLKDEEKAKKELGDIKLYDHTLDSQTSSGSEDTDFRNLSPKERR
jgi:hypothetical protein